MKKGRFFFVFFYRRFLIYILIIKGAYVMNFTVDVMNGEQIKSVRIEASNHKEAKIKVKKKVGKERIIGIKISE